jgi:hypothetical protein
MATEIKIYLPVDLSEESKQEFNIVVRNALIEYRERRTSHCTDKYTVNRVELAKDLIGAMDREDYTINNTVPCEGSEA